MLFHLVVWALVATFIGLGRWQLDVSNTKHFDFFNFQYAIQWWLFAAFGLFVWIRVMRHRLKPPSAGTSRGGGLVVRAGNALEARSGPTLLTTTGTTGDGRPALYRGYVIPQSSSTPVRSHGDSVHDAYNDYLWQLAASDGATPDVSAQLRAEASRDQPTDQSGEPRSTSRELR